MRPLRSLLLTATVAGAVYAWFSFCVLGATGIGAQYCGDGVVQEVYEFCGDGVVQDTESCDVWGVNWTVCVASYGGTCTYCSSDCQRAVVTWPACGDGIVNDNEACDDANDNDADGCTNLCQVTFCWDNAIQAGESCDAGSNNGVVCDPGTGSCTYCSASCEVKTVQWARCGDGVVQAGESCDAWVNNGSVCIPGPGTSCSYCSVTCNEVSLTWAMCGDGRVDAGEACDDGNLNDGDGCSQFCSIEPSILLDTGAWVPPVSEPTTTTVTFGGEPVFLPTFLPNTWGEKTTYRWVELNK